MEYCYLYKRKSFCIYILKLFCFLSVVLVHGQKPIHERTRIKASDTLLSKNTYIQVLSSDGRWVVFKELFDNKANVLHVQHTSNEKRFELEDSYDFDFSNNNQWFGTKSKDSNSFKLIDLLQQQETDFGSISSFQFSADSRFLALLNESNLTLINLETQDTQELKNVKSFKWHPQLNRLMIHRVTATLSTILVYEASTKLLVILEKGKHFEYTKMTWSGSGNSIAFIESSPLQKLHHFRFNDHNLEHQHKVLKVPLVEGSIIEKNIELKNDGSGVFFYRSSLKSEGSVFSGAEIWTTQDPWIVPRMKAYKAREHSFKLVYWDVLNSHTEDLNDEKFPSYRFHPEHPNVLVYNMLSYEPQYKQFPDIDLYIKNLQTGKLKLIVEKISTAPNTFSFSPSGRYVSFFKNGDWWVYDCISENKINVTHDIATSFENKQLYGIENVLPYGNPGWTADEKQLFLYDQYDIWMVGMDNGDPHKITLGKEQGISYRIQVDDSTLLASKTYSTSSVFDIEEGLLLSMKGDDLKSGYAYWSKDLGTKEKVYKPAHVEEGQVSLEGGIIVFKKSKFNSPPSVQAVSLEMSKSRLLYQSNPSLLPLDLGREEVFHYTVNSEFQEKGVLIYPSQFDPNKRYPMVTWIYEQNSVEVNNFSPPSNAGTIGFNILDYVLDGYFVLLPDISYKIGSPGVSALQSVLASIEVVLKQKSIDRTRLGLIGHSFGGYETSYIVSQTNLFSAAVAGAAVTDLISSYHDVAWDWNMNQMWRFEAQQLRMGASYYSSKDAYHQNSPLNYVEDIKTPLLLWAGKQDGNVNWSQSVYLYMGLKRLNSEAKLILFENEGHFLIDKVNQNFLRFETKKWFDTILK